MPSKIIYTEVDGQKLKLTNLHKILYPERGVTKAEVISYHLEVGNYMLPHILKRPLTLIRFPDGIGSKTFYTKNKPSWTPDWMPTSTLPWDEGNQYLYANNKAHVVWLANLAALELHTMNSDLSNINIPNQFIVDLDPPEDWNFERVKETAFKVKDFLISYGYNPYGKLSGGKGIHITVPIKEKWSYEEMIKTVKDLMKIYIKSNPEATLFVHKNKRKDKILLDIYRNHPGNTTVAPYSLRGKPGAPVSMPLLWEELEKAKSAQDYNIENSLVYLKEYGDRWSNIHEHSTDLHDKKTQVVVKESLDSYDAKRDFSKTNEPSSKNVDANFEDSSVNDNFVVQLHDASNLHYDLRLGEDGVLKSWAIPKGLPIEKGIKRLAIQTEDHPAKYIDFEGVIPKEEYGGGEMWIFDTGDVEWVKKTKKHYKFKLKGKYLKAEYNLYKTKANQWILEIMESTHQTVFEKGIKPMLSDVSKNLPKNKDDYLYEIKWDGIRVIVYKNRDQLKILSRSGRDITNKFPEFQELKFCRVQNAVFDAELVCLDEKGRPMFSDIISRMHRIGNIALAAKSKPVYLYVFDCLFLDGMNLMNLDYVTRRKFLRPIIKFGNLVRESEIFEDGKQIFQAAKSMELEGIMAKNKKGKYFPDSRSDVWKKIKFRQTIDCSIIGYTKGQGDRANLFGALHLAVINEKGWTYYGKVGTGFDHTKMKEVLGKLKKLEETSKPINDTIEEEYNTTWIEPTYKCEIIYASLSSNNTLREPVFKKMWHKDLG